MVAIFNDTTFWFVNFSTYKVQFKDYILNFPFPFLAGKKFPPFIVLP